MHIGGAVNSGSAESEKCDKLADIYAKRDNNGQNVENETKKLLKMARSCMI